MKRNGIWSSFEAIKFLSTANLHCTLTVTAGLNMYFSFRDAVVPPPPQGHKWKAVQHDNKVSKLN